MPVSLRRLAVLLAAIVAAGCDRDVDQLAGPSAPKSVGPNTAVTDPATGTSQVSAGSWHTCAMRVDGNLFCWGNNDYGVASPPPGTYSELDAGDGFTCAVSSAGEIACWGRNVYGELNVPAPPDGLSYVQASAGALNACGVRSDGSLACWGNSMTRVSSPPPGSYTQVSVGKSHACAIRTDGTLACWGTDADLISGAPAPPAGHGFTHVAAGLVHNCALLDDGSVQCWGQNETGQLNVPPLAAGVHYTQVSVSHNYRLDLDPQHIIAAQHSCALRSDGTAVCWGNNSWGQGNVPALPVGTTYTSVSAGLWHTCVARSDGAVLCSGNDWEGQIDVPPTLNLLKRSQPIVFTPSVPNTAVLGTVFRLVPNVGSGNPVVLQSLTPFVCTFSEDYQYDVGFNTEGTCSFTANRAGSADYDDAPPLTVTVTVAKGIQTIAYTSTPPNPAYVGDSYAVSADGGGSGNRVVFSSLTTGTCTVTGSTATFVAPGDCTVAANQFGNGSYHAAAQVTQTFAVARGLQTITFNPALPAEAFLDATLSVAATGGASGNPVTFSVLTPGTCTLSGTTLRLTSVGACTVTADQSGNANYEPATRQTATIAVRYRFTGFVGLAASPTVNQVTAGRIVNLVFTLGADRGVGIFAAGSPSIALYTCGATPPAPGSGSPISGTIDHREKTNQYTYKWSTGKTWVTQCGQLTVRLIDGSVRTWQFRFVK